MSELRSSNRGGGRTVDGDAEEVTDLLDLGPCQLERAEVPEHEVVNGVIVRATLARGEHGIIYALLEVLVCLAVFAEEDKARTRATKRLVSVMALLRCRPNEIPDLGTYVVVVTTSQYLKGSASSWAATRPDV